MVLPNGAIIHPLAGENLGALEPHFLQKALPKVLGASMTYSSTLSLSCKPLKLICFDKEVRCKCSARYLSAPRALTHPKKLIGS